MVMDRILGKTPDISQYTAMVDDMKEEGKPLRDYYQEIDKVVHGEWELTEELEGLDWVGKFVSSDASSALETAIKTLAQEKPKYFIKQNAPGQENAETVDKIEQWLLWQIRRADYRTDKDIVTDIARSAVRYDYTAVHLTHLGHQIEAMQDAKKEYPKWYEEQEGYGSFAFKVANPANVYFRRGMWGLEVVAHVYEDKASSVVEDYKGEAKAIERRIKERGEDFDVTVHDLTTRDKRVVWVSEVYAEADDENVNEESAQNVQHLIRFKDRTLPFIPWAIRSGGTELETNPKYAVNPLLGRIVLTDLYDIQNSILSITYSEAVATSAMPRFAIIGPNGDIVQVEYHNPTRLMPVPDGHELVELQGRQIDEGLLHLSDRIKAMMDRETVARFLQNLDLPEGVAFASINAVMQAAISALDKYKKVAEDTLVDLAVLMLKYFYYRKEEDVIYGYGDDKRQAQISYEDFDPKALYIDCEISAHAPTDYMQRINAAVMMHEKMKAPLEETFRWFGVANPKEWVEKYTQERLNDFALKQKLTELQTQQQAALQASIRAKMAPPMAARGEARARRESLNEAMANRRPANRRQFELARRRSMGQGANTGQGGMSPQNLQPGATRERITGQDREGGTLVT